MVSFFLSLEVHAIVSSSIVMQFLCWDISRVKRLTRMSEKVATGILSGVVSVSGLVTSSIVNSKAGKKFFSLLPGEILLASLEGFSKSFISNSLVSCNLRIQFYVYVYVCN